MKFPLLQFMRIPFVAISTRSLTALMVVTLLTLGVSAQKLVRSTDVLIDVNGSDTTSEGAGDGIPFPGNPTCADLNASSDPAFAHITVDFGLKINRAGTFHEQFFFVNGASTELQGGAAPSPSSFVWVDADGTTLDWTSNRLITAVIVKAGTIGANVYPYNPAVQFGNDLTTGSQNTISHLVFCFENLTPTAAPASISGRATDAFGYGISGARLSLLDPQSGTTITTLTNTFGYYTITGAEVGNFYLLTINHRRYSFADDTRTFSLTDDIAGVDFIANP